MRYYNRLYSDIKDTLRNENTNEEAPFFGPPINQRTASDLQTNEVKIEVPRESF